MEPDAQIPDRLKGELLLFRSIWNHSDDNMFVVVCRDGDFFIEAVNPAQERLFGLEPHQLDGKNIEEVLDPHIYPRIVARYRECIDAKRPITYEEQHLFGGEERFWSTTILPVVDDEKGEMRIFGISREFTELKRTEKALKSTNETLEQTVAERTAALEKSNEQLRALSLTDALTGIYNRRALFEIAEPMLRVARRNREALGMILFDLDDFKQINDTYGHIVGDRVLEHLAAGIRHLLRESDVFARYGGEEFIVLLPKTSLEGALVIAEKIRGFAESTPFVNGSETIGTSVSIGVCGFEGELKIDTIISRVDEALYRAKTGGKNRIEVVG